LNRFDKKGPPIKPEKVSLSIELIKGIFLLNVISFSATLPLYLAVGIAILRYPQFDIDLIIRKTLTYALLTGLLALVYFGLIAVLQGMFSTISRRSSEIILVISTLGMAALFNPLRRRIQTLIDHYFYRNKYDAD
jgi:hypothetical protein